jgi:hypothetical protein
LEQPLKEKVRSGYAYGGLINAVSLLCQAEGSGGKGFGL